MKYREIVEGAFIDRPNRFIAHVDVNDTVETVHVKNTGRCRELLVPGAAVRLEVSDNPKRKTKYDLVMVHKQGLGWVNMDSQAPNKVVAEWLATGDYDLVKSEYTYGKSRIDFYMEKNGEKYLLEVKGCTLEVDGIGYFQIKLNSKEPITSPKQKANQMKLKANISFKADAKLKRSVSVVHMERSKLRRHSASRSNDEIDKLLTSYFSNNPVLTRGDFQGLCNFTSTTASRHIKRLKEEKKLKNINSYYNPIYVPMPGYYGKEEIKTNQGYNIEKEN